MSKEKRRFFDKLWFYYDDDGKLKQFYKIVIYHGFDADGYLIYNSKKIPYNGSQMGFRYRCPVSACGKNIKRHVRLSDLDARGQFLINNYEARGMPRV